jgi:cell division protease FtsH
MSKVVDSEIKRIVEEGLNKAREIVREKRELLDAIANKLIEVENLERDDFELLLRAHGVAIKK